jgi:hypothetical protein
MICNNTLNSYQKWFIGNDIRDILLADSGVSSQVSAEHIYPLVAPENTKGDFIVYIRQKYGKDTVKQGVYQDDCEVAVIGVRDNYDNAIALAAKIDNALTGTHVNEDGKRIDIILIDSTEVFDDNKYIETLVFKIN